jgi:hypothetical protein
MARRGVEAVEIVRAREMNVKNGCPAMRSPRIGLETEVERKEPGIERVREVILRGDEGAGRER